MGLIISIVLSRYMCIVHACKLSRSDRGKAQTRTYMCAYAFNTLREFSLSRWIHALCLSEWALFASSLCIYFSIPFISFSLFRTHTFFELTDDVALHKLIENKLLSQIDCRHTNLFILIVILINDNLRNINSTIYTTTTHSHNAILRIFCVRTDFSSA